MTRRELTKARALYIGHLVVGLLGYGCVIWLASKYLGASYEQDGAAGFVLYLACIVGGFKVVDLVVDPLFKRKNPAWKSGRRPPEDRWPRATEPTSVGSSE